MEFRRRGLIATPVDVDGRRPRDSVPITSIDKAPVEPDMRESSSNYDIDPDEVSCTINRAMSGTCDEPGGDCDEVKSELAHRQSNMKSMAVNIVQSSNRGI